MNTSSNSSGIDTNYKIIIPSKIKKRDGISVETNTEPWFSICQSCLEKQKERENNTWDVGDNVDINEYAKAINYINSIHNFINEALIGKQNEPRGSGISINSSFSMPDLPNFLTIFSNICGLNKPEKSQMPTKSTSTTTLLPLCAALKRYTEQEELESLLIGIQNNDDQNIEKHSKNIETSISRYHIPSLPSYLMDSLPKTPSNDQNANKSQNRLKLKDNDSVCSCSTRSSEKHSNKKINIISVPSKPPAKVDSHWRGTEKKYEFLFNKKPVKKIEKPVSSKRNSLSDAEIDLYANQLLNKPVSDCKNYLKKPQESQSSKSESLNKQKLKIARMTLEKKKLVQKARDELPSKVKEKPVTALPVKKRISTGDKEKCKLKACNSESCHRTKSKRNLSNNWSVSQETAQDALFHDVINSKKYATLECSMLQDERQILKFGVDHPIMSFQLPSLTDMQVRCDNKAHKNSNSKKSITSLPNHIAVALPHTEEKSPTFLTKSNIFNHNSSYVQNHLESKSSESMILDDQDLETCTDSDICDDMTDTAENNTESKTTDVSKSQPIIESTIEPFQQIRVFKSNAEKAKFKNFFTYQRKKYLKYSDSLSNDTISSDITSIPDLENEIIIGKVST